MDPEVKEKLDALLKKLESDDCDVSTIAPGQSSLFTKILLYIADRLDTLTE